MRKGLFVISGCPRSGTSAMSDIMVKMLGLDRMVYKELEDRAPKERKFKEGKIGNVQKYLYNLPKNVERRAERKEKMEERRAKAESMNPKGFYEDGRFSVRGITWNPLWKEELEDFANNPIPKAIKIVSQGLLATDPKYISKIIYMIRHPREVAKSQENLQRSMENATKDGVEQKEHSPMMYIQVTTAAAQFFLLNPEVPVLFCQHSDMLSDPKTHTKKVAKFLELGSNEAWEKAKDVIEPRLHRSKPQDIESKLWKPAEAIFDMFNKKDFQGVVDYMNTDEESGEIGEGVKLIQAGTRKWHCPRVGKDVDANVCNLCQNEPNTQRNYKDRAIGAFINWREEPCLFECGFDTSKTEDELLTIEESIQNNFWAI